MSSGTLPVTVVAGKGEAEGRISRRDTVLCRDLVCSSFNVVRP